MSQCSTGATEVDKRLQRQTCSVKEAATALGISEPTVWRLSATRQLRSVRLMNRRLIIIDSINELLAKQASAAD